MKPIAGSTPKATTRSARLIGRIRALKPAISTSPGALFTSRPTAAPIMLSANMYFTQPIARPISAPARAGFSRHAILPHDHQHARDDHHHGERDRQEDLPAEAHQLVVAIARHEGLHERDPEEEEADLQHEPDDARHPREGHERD